LVLKSCCLYVGETKELLLFYQNWAAMLQSQRFGLQQHSRRSTLQQQQQQVGLQRRAVVCHSTVLHGDHGHGNHAVKWYEKHKVSAAC